MSLGGKTAQRNTITKNASHIPDVVVRRTPRVQKPTPVSSNSDAPTFLRPLSRSVPRAKPTLFKSSSCHNIKSSHSNSQSSLDSCGSGKGTKPKRNPCRKPTSTVALPAAVLRESNSSTSSCSNTVNGDRICVNSDLLSRVEKEKKQYEARISELTQLTESRKIEIERLSFEVRNLKEAKERVEALVQRQGSHSLKRKIADLDPDEGPSCPSCLRPLPEPSSSTPTTSSDQQSLASGMSSFFVEENVKPPSVKNLENRIHEMEEANYTTTEELQATMGELCEMQRILDETQEENRNLAFERAILLESLCTQTAKLEHCRLQIEQLKHLLVTNPPANDRDSREAHYVELYTSVEEEKQIVLAQNNDLAQRCESLDAECRQLSEKVDSLTEETERLKAVATMAATANGDELTTVTMKTNSFEEAEVELSTQMEMLMRQVAVWKQKFEMEVKEHEREVTELRLHERHLLKTVQVADGIRMESEAEVARIAIETHELRDQVKSLSADLENAIRECSDLRDKLSKTSVGEESASESSEMPRLPAPPPRVETKTVATMTSPTETSFISKSAVHTTTGAITTTAPNSSTFQHLHRTTYMQKLGLNPSATVSPGGPGGVSGGGTGGGGVSGIRRTGSTVQSLIQTIENQVKAVQHQQKVSTVRPSATAAKTNLGGGIVGGTTERSSDRDGCNDLPTRRLHSAGNSPNSTPVRSAPRHSLLDEPLACDSAPGGPPPPTSPTLASATSSQPSPSIQTTPASLLRSKPLFNASLGDTSPAKDSFLLKYPNTSSTASTVPSTTIPTSTSAPTTSRLKRHLTAPTTSPSAVAAKVSAAGTISEAVSTVLSAAAGDSVPPSATSTDSTTASVNIPTNSKSSASTTVVADATVDPLQQLAKRTNTGSKRNALLRWCQARVTGYCGVEVTNFSSSWNDGLALCALLHTFLPQRISLNWERVLNDMDKQRRFEVAFAAAESQGIPTTLRLGDMLTKDRPDWNCVMAYIASIYKHFEATP